MGIGASLREGSLPREWFDGIAFIEEQVEELAYQVNAKRQDEAAIRKSARGGGMFRG